MLFVCCLDFEQPANFFAVVVVVYAAVVLILVGFGLVWGGVLFVFVLFLWFFFVVVAC